MINLLQLASAGKSLVKKMYSYLSSPQDEGFPLSLVFLSSVNSDLQLLCVNSQLVDIAEKRVKFMVFRGVMHKEKHGFI